MTEAPDEDGIVFETADKPAEMTAVESILPWRRKSSFAPDDVQEQDGDEDNASLVLKQEEFPPWITNKEYLPNYASPSTTVIQALDRDRNPHVFQIFEEQDAGRLSAARDEARTTTPVRLSSKDKAKSGSDNAAFVADNDMPSTRL